MFHWVIVVAVFIVGTAFGCFVTTMLVLKTALFLVKDARTFWGDAVSTYFVRKSQFIRELGKDDKSPISGVKNYN